MLDAVTFDESGLVPVIAQDVDTDRVLMVAWMNREALAETVETGRAVYFSRSRQRLWRKGEESGHVQHVRGLRLDCDGDVILMRVEQVGGIACHTGREHCFYRELDMASGEWHSVEPVVRSPEAIYGASGGRGEGERGAAERGAAESGAAADDVGERPGGPGGEGGNGSGGRGDRPSGGEPDAGGPRPESPAPDTPDGPS